MFFSLTEFIYEWFLRDRFVFGIDFAVVLILRVRFFTKIQDQIKKIWISRILSLRKETMYPKRDYYSFISVETTHNTDSIPEKEYHGCWQCWKFTTFIVFWTVSLRALLLIDGPNEDESWNKICIGKVKSYKTTREVV